MTIAEWLKNTTNELADAMLPSPRLDAEIILAHTLRRPRTYLQAHNDDTISSRTEDIANARIDLRLDRVPIAYIIGHKEFYGRQFNVNPSVLIPRPESEQLISILKQLLPATAALPGAPARHMVDIGTGSGCLGITTKLEFPELNVSLTDISRYALLVAEKNAKSLGAEVELFRSDLLNTYPYSPSIVLANLPYVDRSWDFLSPELASEPSQALYAEDGGLAIIKRCIEQTAARSEPGMLLLLEADTSQLDAIASYARSYKFKERLRDEFAVALELT